MEEDFILRKLPAQPSCKFPRNCWSEFGVGGGLPLILQLDSFAFMGGSTEGLILFLRRYSEGVGGEAVLRKKDLRKGS